MSRVLIPIAVLVSAALAVAPTTKKVITIAVVRHAEKKGDLGDAGLSPKGLERAERLASVFRRAKIDALIASDLKRTRETLQPIADEKKLPIKGIKEPEDVVKALKALPPGSFAVVAHHSYTLKEILKGLGVAAEEAEAIELEEYDNLLLVTYHLDIDTRLLNLTY